LCAFWSAGARVVPDQVCGYQRATWLMHKHYLHAIVECPCRLVGKTLPLSNILLPDLEK